MAKPIKETPTLYGEDARRFLEEIGDAPVRPESAGSVSLKRKYPDYDLIETLSRKYLGGSINALSQGETIDLINHLREAVRSLKKQNDHVEREQNNHRRNE